MSNHGELLGEYGLTEHLVDTHPEALIAVLWVVFESEGYEPARTPEDTTDRFVTLGHVER